MQNTVFELLVVVALIVFNGFFAATEIAIISLRKSRTNEIIMRGDKRGKMIADLQSHPERLLATIQLGKTVIGTIASVFGGHIFVEKISPLIKSLPVEFISSHADGISLTIIILVISYLEILIGEVLPKSLALYFAEWIALKLIYPFMFFSRLAHPFVRFLTFTSDIVLAPFKKSKTYSESKITQEELRYLITEGEKSGALEKEEHEIIENLLRFSDRAISKIMTPAVKIQGINSDDSPSIILHELYKSKHSRLPVYKDQLDNIIGVFQVLEILKDKPTKDNFKIDNYLHQILFIPTTQKLPDALRKMRKSSTHMAMVVDEHGGVAGLATMEDILEELVGEIKDEKDEPTQNILEIGPNHYLVLGETSITDINRELHLELPEAEHYTTLSGFILDTCGRFPHVGETIEQNNVKFVIRSVGPKTINQVELKMS